ncbi:MAG TPA: hypothetical protein VL173_18515 [Vicinamibacterales bacterium]|jgi:opacity protein-like surface antigen|nr:hypothetical protein [Vicinamibacterales bacterium]
MRTLLFATLFTTIATAAVAQDAIGPWEPHATVGIGGGLSGDGDAFSDDGNRLLSGTFEVPISTGARFRVETARTTTPVLGSRVLPATPPTDLAHLSRLTISVAALKAPGAGATTYVGVGLGLYQATYNRAPKSPYRLGTYLHGGVEIELSDQVTLDAEIGLHLLRAGSLYPTSTLPCEALVRLKLAM